MSTSDPFRAALERDGYVLLDGGLATALEARGRVLDSTLWSAALLRDAPEEIRAVHADYLEAGARCITTASYQASFEGFRESGIDDPLATALLHRSTEVAVSARDEHSSQALVAASIGPYGAYLANGSEYDGRYAVGAAELEHFHRRRLAVLLESGPDLLACETLPSAVEVDVLLRLLDEHHGASAWFSFSCRDGRSLWDGTPIEAVARACAEHAGVVAVGVNCTAPVHLAELVGRARSACDLPLIAYPNSGEVYDADSGRWSSGAETGEGGGWMAGVLGALEAGARIVGGCCRVGPAEIGELRVALATGDWTWPPH